MRFARFHPSSKLLHTLAASRHSCVLHGHSHSIAAGITTSLHSSRLFIPIVLTLFETTLNVQYFPRHPHSSPLLYIPPHPLHLPARLRCFAPFFPILLPPHDARRPAVGALPIVRRFLLQLRAGAVHVEDEVARCAAQHLAWLVTHLAQVVVLVEKILFVEDHPGRRLGSLGLLGRF